MSEYLNIAFDEALDRYRNFFNDSFPTMALYNGDKETIEIIDRCIENKKNVYEMGFLTLNRDNLY